MELSGFRHRLLQLLAGVLLLPAISPVASLASPYLSPNTILRDFPRMIQNFRIFAYPCLGTNSSGFRPGSPADLFHASLLRSNFLTPDPEEADLFYISFSGAASPRSVARSVRRLRSELPFWNRTLGADHFFVMEEGIGESADRNLVELRKNSVQISPFPTAPGRFIPHKDLTLPSTSIASPPRSPEDPSFQFLAYYDGMAADRAVLALLDELRRVPGVMIESGHHEPSKRAQVMSSTRFCLFFHGFDADPPLGEALTAGCVPVVVAGGPILDLPFSDVLRWSEMALFVPLKGGAEAVRRTMDVAGGETHAQMRVTAMQASALFRWGLPGLPVAAQEPSDAFHAVLFQLWRRRHTIRYARWAERRSNS